MFFSSNKHKKRTVNEEYAPVVEQAIISNQKKLNTSSADERNATQR